MVFQLEHYQDKAEKMIKADEKRDINNRQYDDMDHVEWVPNKKLDDLWWFRATPSTEPHDSLATGVSVLSSQEEDVTLQPIASNPETKRKANNDEKVLKWQMEQANKRRQGTVQKSVVRSSLKYDEVCVQVVDLDYQILNKEESGADTKREKAARRYGRFLVNTYHPNEVHVQHSNMMPESVLLVQKRKAKEVMQEYGEAASGLKDKAENDDDVELYDYWDYDDHVVWTQDKQGGGENELIRDKHDLPFLPWVARVGGDIMESKQEHRRRPILYAVNQSRAWKTQNVVKSLRVSGVIRDFSTPPLVEESDMPIDARNTQVEAGDAGLLAQASPGSTLKPLPPNQMDPAMREVDEMLKQDISRSTIPEVLQGGQAASGEAFASLNLRTQTAVGKLKPAQELAEYALADIYTMFLLWAQHTENSIEGYGTGKNDIGEQYVIEHDEIPEHIYLSVKLKPDVPLDRMQRANTAMLMVNAGIYSKERAMGDMGITDPDQVTEEMFFERMTEARWQNMIDGMALQQQMDMQQKQLAAQQTQLAGAPGGPGFNPAQGGGPPAEAAPGATREGVSGLDRLGNEALVGGGFE